MIAVRFTFASKEYMERLSDSYDPDRLFTRSCKAKGNRDVIS